MFHHTKSLSVFNLNLTFNRNELEERNSTIQAMLLTMSKMNYTAAENKGKGIDEVGERQKRRNIMAIRESTKKALWFLDSFNVDLSTIILKSKS